MKERNMDERYVDYAVEKTLSLLAIDSPTGYTEAVAAEVRKEFENLGFGTELTNKGGVLVDLGGVMTATGSSSWLTWTPSVRWCAR